MNIKVKLRDFARSFKYAFIGLKMCIESERNIRVHLCAAFYVLCFMQFYDFTRAEKSVLLLTIGIVMGFELLNTAIEVCVDLISPQYHDLAKKAKDIAAGAVLCVSVFALVIGCIFFLDVAVLKDILTYFKSHIFLLIAFVISLALWATFILSVKTNKKIPDKKDKDIK